MCLALGFGSGLWRRGPGTMGSVVGVLLFLPLIATPWYVKGGAILVAAALGCFICEYAASD